MKISPIVCIAKVNTADSIINIEYRIDSFVHSFGLATSYAMASLILVMLI